MNRIHACLAALIFGGASAMAGPFFPYRSETHVLPNGLTVILVSMDSPGLVAYYTVVRTGSRDEVEPRRSGFAHFFEHMMFRGTKKYPGDVYDRIMTGLGADANAYTTDDYTAYHINFAAEDLPKIVEMESDRFQNLSYEEREFKTEAGAVYGEYRKSVTSPFFLLSEKTQDLAYDSHTYKHTTMGFEADIKAMPDGYEYSWSFFRRFYRPENVVLVIAGDIDPSRTLALVTSAYGSWERGYTPPAIVKEPPQRAAREAAISYPGKTLPLLNLAFKGDAFDPANRTWVAALLLGELAFGETSALYKKLYIREQAVQFINAGIPMNRDRPLFEITAMVRDTSALSQVRGDILSTIADFQKIRVDTRRLEELKSRERYDFLMRLDTPDHVAGTLARIVAVTGGIAAVDVLYATMESITPDDIQKAARTYFVPEQSTTVLLQGGVK